MRTAFSAAAAAAVCAAFAVALSVGPGHASAQAATAPAPAASAPHSGPEHTARIRSAHFNRLKERIERPAATLRETCRFESEVASLPPPQTVALTFDDGPEPGQTEHILEVLARHRVPATFFVIGEKAQRHPELLALMRALPGARVGNHSWSHPNFHQIEAPAQRLEIDRNEALLDAAVTPAMAAESATAPAGGAEAEAAGKLFRYPYGNSSCEGNQHLHERGYRIVGWHVDSCDWAFDGDGSVDAHEALSCGVLPAFRRDFLGHVLAAVRAHRGGIVLMHETHKDTLRQLDELVQRLQDEGYQFSTPDDPSFAASLR